VSLIHSYPAILFTPAAISVLATSQFLADNADGILVVEQDFGFVELDMVIISEFYSRSK
jgi:hypothetical protein